MTSSRWRRPSVSTGRRCDRHTLQGKAQRHSLTVTMVTTQVKVYCTEGGGHSTGRHETRGRGNRKHRETGICNRKSGPEMDPRSRKRKRTLWPCTPHTAGPLFGVWGRSSFPRGVGVGCPRRAWGLGRATSGYIGVAPAPSRPSDTFSRIVPFSLSSHHKRKNRKMETAGPTYRTTKPRRQRTEKRDEQHTEQGKMAAALVRGLSHVT